MYKIILTLRYGLWDWEIINEDDRVVDKGGATTREFAIECATTAFDRAQED